MLKVDAINIIAENHGTDHNEENLSWREHEETVLHEHSANGKNCLSYQKKKKKKFKDIKLICFVNFTIYDTEFSCENNFKRSL